MLQHNLSSMNWVGENLLRALATEPPSSFNVMIGGLTHTKLN